MRRFAYILICAICLCLVGLANAAEKLANYSESGPQVAHGPTGVKKQIT